MGRVSEVDLTPASTSGRHMGCTWHGEARVMKNKYDDARRRDDSGASGIEAGWTAAGASPRKNTNVDLYMYAELVACRSQAVTPERACPVNVCVFTHQRPCKK